MKITEYQRSTEQDEILGISDMKTEGYAKGGEEAEGHGTDKMVDLPDRIQHKHERGPDHPNVFGKPEVEGDQTGYGKDSKVWRTESDRRGEVETNEVEKGEVWERESKDERFVEWKDWDGMREGMVFKLGAQGLGYYSNTGG